MRRWLAAVLALLAAPAAAQEAPAWVGVWEGRVGTYPVRLCIDTWGEQPARGAYYYLSQLEPIALSEEDGERGWIERAPDGEQQALWEFAEQNGERLRGTWRQGPRRLPFDLTPTAWTEGEWGGPCASSEFLAPRLGGGEIVSESAEREGWRYTQRRYRPAAHFEDVAIESFNFPPVHPGDAAINAVLSSYLPRETADDDFVQCFAGNISSVGADGFYDLSVQPSLVSSPFLTFAEWNDQSCGGTHPNTWTVHRTFDRHTGREIDLFDWIGASANEDRTGPLSDALRERVLERWPAETDNGDEECREVVFRPRYWRLELQERGIAFTPDLPRVVMACGGTVLLTWPDLEPFLDDEGRAGLARLRGD